MVKEKRERIISNKELEPGRMFDSVRFVSCIPIERSC